MACSPEILKRVPLFALLDDDETAVLAAQVELKTSPRASGSGRLAIPADKLTSWSPARCGSQRLMRITRK